jgi:hypothetical protein
MNLVRVRAAVPCENTRVDVTFTDGTRRYIDLAPYLVGPIFELVRDEPAFFRSLRVEEGTIAWPNGADIDPDVLYHGLTPARAESAGATKAG